MKYEANAFGGTRQIELTKEGLQIGQRQLDFADIAALRPVNHRVFVDLFSGESVELSMLGFSYDGFWEELMEKFSQRSMEALFVEESPLMQCEGEYRFAAQQGRGQILLLPDAVCIVPQSCHAVRIPLCFAEDITLEGYQLFITLNTGERYMVGRMGYDTKAFAERSIQASHDVKRQRSALLSSHDCPAPFTMRGLFRTAQQDEYYLAAIKNGKCAVELFTHTDAATYLYQFTEDDDLFAQCLAQAMEAVGSHREIIYISQEQLEDKPLFRMALMRCAAVRFLRSKSAGRLIHNANHARALAEFLNA